MVILETAAITAAGYGLYRGGDAAVRKGKETQKEFVRERARNSERTELNQKTKSRQDRVSELLKMRTQPPTTSSSGSTLTSSGSNLSATTPDWDSGMTPSTTSTREPSSSTSSSINDRHKNVMEKLRSSRAQETNKSGGGKLLGFFGKKK